MALTELLLSTRLASIGAVTLDASIKELHRASARATDHPVEAEGTDDPDVVSDHIRVDPRVISIEGVVTNTPAEVAGLLSAAVDGNYDPAGDAFKQFLEDLRGKRLVAVVTTLETLTDVVLEEVSVQRDADKGNALFFSATGKQIRKVTTETVEVPILGATKRAGKKPTKTPKPEPEAEAESFLRRALSR